MRFLPAFVLLLILIWVGLRRLEQASLYYPDRQILADPHYLSLPFEAVNLITTDNVRIHGWWIPAKQSGPQTPTILLCHGNAGNISHRLDKAKRLHGAGINIFLFDYRGYGESETRALSEKGTYADAEAAYSYLVQTRGILPAHLFVQGESLGGAMATEIALRHPVAGLILESAFTSTMAMAKRIFPWLPAGLIIRNRYDTLRKIPKLKIPILFLHSRTDEMVPFAMAEQNFQAAHEPKQLVELIGDHNEGYATSGPIYINAIAKFVAMKNTLLVHP